VEVGYALNFDRILAHHGRILRFVHDASVRPGNRRLLRPHPAEHDAGVGFGLYVLMSSSATRPASPFWSATFDACVYVSNVDELAAELCAKNADLVEGPINRIYEMRGLLVRDCNWLVLSFGQG